jgi:hypothetical protein
MLQMDKMYYLCTLIIVYYGEELNMSDLIN